MKRHNNLFDKIVDKDNLLLAYKKAKKHKSWQQKVIRVEKDLDNLIEELRLSLINGTYKTAEYRTKKIYEPKERTIYVLPFYPDRIVHHAIMNILEPIWDNLFISDSYACRNGKGQHKGSQKCMEFVRKNKYCLKCDINKFYPSINHEILKLIIRKKIKCKRTLNLLDTIIDSIDGETNIPIGNYLSQWFGNLYLNELDMFMKHDNKIKCYIRYCDDFLLFSNDKALLKEMAIKIKDYVENIFHLVRRIIMYGYPKALKTKEDYEYVRNYFPKELWKKDFQALLDTQYDWFFIDKLLKNEGVVLKKNQRIEYNEELDERYLYEYKYNPNCKLATIGYSEEEVQSILQED